MSLNWYEPVCRADHVKPWLAMSWKAKIVGVSITKPYFPRSFSKMLSLPHLQVLFKLTWNSACEMSGIPLKAPETCSVFLHFFLFFYVISFSHFWPEEICQAFKTQLSVIFSLKSFQNHGLHFIIYQSIWLIVHRGDFFLTYLINK